MQHDAFLVHARLGSGSTGAVFRATRPDSGRQVALKALHPEFVRSADLDHLRAVVDALSTFEHHAVANNVELAEWRGDTVLIRDLVRGIDLATVVAGSAPPQRIALHLAAEIAGALASFEKATGFTHGDVKPSNVFLDVHGEVTLVDFGMAQPVPDQVDRTLTMFHGSVGFMSPERADNQTSDTADVYSVALLTAWLLTGEMPRRTSANPRRHKTQREALLERVGANGPPDGGVELIAACTEYDPRKRPTMADVARRLAELAARVSGPPVISWAGPLVEALVVAPTEVEISDVGQPLSATADIAPIRQAAATRKGQPFARIDTGAHSLPEQSLPTRVKPATLVLGFLALVILVAIVAAGIALATQG